MKRIRKKTVRIGPVKIGGDNPILLQSMTTVRTAHIKQVLNQINMLAAAGCGLVRVSVLDRKDTAALSAIVTGSPLPICADIHFSFELALLAIEAGVQKIRINPGNIGGREKVRAVFQAAKKHKVAVRIGVNSGSLPKGVTPLFYQNKKKGVTPIVQKFIAIAEKENFTNLVLSIKSSDPVETIEANRVLAKKTKYPIHLGVTATGAGLDAIIKSTTALSTLLAEGIGDTIRVSLTANPREEVRVGQKILQSLKLLQRPYEVIACPTCGRTEVNIIRMTKQVERAMEEMFKGARSKGHVAREKKRTMPSAPYTLPLKIAVMGCVVNGPGEARECDFGIAGGRGFGFIFKKGKRIDKKIPEKDLVKELIREIIKG